MNLYLISTDPRLEYDFQKPRIPNNFLTQGKHCNWKLPRIPLYKTPEDALSGYTLGQKLESGMTYYLYKAVGIMKKNLLEPDIIDLPYITVLEEYWYCINLKVQLVGVIKVGQLKEIDTYRYGPRQSMEEVYRWNYVVENEKRPLFRVKK